MTSYPVASHTDSRAATQLDGAEYALDGVKIGAALVEMDIALGSGPAKIVYSVQTYRNGKYSGCAPTDKFDRTSEASARAFFATGCASLAARAGA